MAERAAVPETALQRGVRRRSRSVLQYINLALVLVGCLIFDCFETEFISRTCFLKTMLQKSRCQF